MSFSPPPILHATAESVKTEIIPCTLLPGSRGTFELIRHGNLVTTCSDIFRENMIPARKDTVIAQIPEGFRPAHQVNGVAITNYAVAYINVNPDGELRVLSTGDVWYSIMFSPLTWVIPD